MHIAVAGNIGAGKTTLVKRLAEHYQWQTCLESVEDNPYLESFYEDMPRWAFHLQIYFLHSRFKQVRQVQDTQSPTVQDRTIYEDAHVFAKNLKDSGYMALRDYQNYFSVFQTMIQFVNPPDLLIYLRGDLDALKARIKQRARHYEEAIPDAYLLSLNDYYEEWVENYQLGSKIIIDISQNDLREEESAWQGLLSQIEAQRAITL